jgi:hypothetical protein
MPISDFFSSGNFAFFPQKSFEGVILDFLLSHGKHLPRNRWPKVLCQFDCNIEKACLL